MPRWHEATLPCVAPSLPASVRVVLEATERITDRNDRATAWIGGNAPDLPPPPRTGLSASEALPGGSVTRSSLHLQTGAVVRAGEVPTAWFSLVAVTLAPATLAVLSGAIPGVHRISLVNPDGKRSHLLPLRVGPRLAPRPCPSRPRGGAPTQGVRRVGCSSRPVGEGGSVRVATWNVNSIRMRLERLLDWLDRRRPDVVALQETKATDEAFPREPLEARGYHVEAFGQKTWNGVALLARSPLAEVVRGWPDAWDAEARLLAATVGDLRVVCVYVPNGQAPESPKFAYKLEWLARLRRFLDGWASPQDAVVVGGDFNVAPEDRDVHAPEAWRGQVLFHPKEHEALAHLRAWGLRDLLREHDERPGVYSWWDYRMLAFPKDHGLRIDLVLGTAAASRRCRGVLVDRDARKGEKPSDHAPVVAFLDEPATFS